jgi:hypothetical protein
LHSTIYMAHTVPRHRCYWRRCFAYIVLQEGLFCARTTCRSSVCMAATADFGDCMHTKPARCFTTYCLSFICLLVNVPEDLTATFFVLCVQVPKLLRAAVRRPDRRLRHLLVGTAQLFTTCMMQLHAACCCEARQADDRCENARLLLSSTCVLLSSACVLLAAPASHV